MQYGGISPDSQTLFQREFALLNERVRVTGHFSIQFECLSCKLPVWIGFLENRFNAEAAVWRPIGIPRSGAPKALLRASVEL